MGGFGQKSSHMADSADPARRYADDEAPGSAGDLTLDQLIEFFDDAAWKLVSAGVPAERLADALKIVATRTEILRRQGSYSGPERRAPGRPWAGPNQKLRSG